MKFTLNKYGKTKVLTVGQKVRCVYFHENSGMTEIRKRSLLSRLIDRPFKPVKLGVILGDAGTHSYWLGTENKEQYLFVKFREYLFPKAIPISCIHDALESAKSTKEMLERDSHLIGQKGYSVEAFDSLSESMNEAFAFVGKQ